MLRTRVIPSLLISDGGLVKTVRFKDPKYVGDPINAVKIFNDKEVDEIVILDIDASKQARGPRFDFLAGITREAFMPMGYGGGIRNVEDVRRLLSLGFEKVVINSMALERPEFLAEVAETCGGQSVVGSIDVKKSLFGGRKVFSHSGKQAKITDPLELALQMRKLGVGEILLNSVDRDGTFEGYDLPLIKSISEAVDIPVVAIGGAGKLSDFGAAVKEGKAAAVAAGSFFVFHGPHRAVLITYPGQDELKKVFA